MAIKPRRQTVAQIKAQKEAERVARLQRYQADIQKMYEGVIDVAANAAVGLQLKDGIFTLQKHPTLNRIVSGQLKQLSIKIDTYLHEKVQFEYRQSDIDNDDLFKTILKPKNLDSVLINYRNEAAFKQFLKEVDSPQGLKLSTKIINYVGSFRQELEVLLGDGVANGRSARVMAADGKQYLNEPDKLFRRVRVDGKLKLSKPALEYNPGQGVYRSSHKNMMRITRTVNNTAYRRADHERYQGSPFVVGIQVMLSGRHPKEDICDQLKGPYPKKFVFIGWHPQCLCYNVPMLLTPAQYDRMENDLLAGKDVSKITYTDRPAPTGDQARAWFEANKERIDNWKSKPFFLTDNENFFKTG